jgi:general secretion pathway protein A
MILDPTYKSEYQFLQSISRMFDIKSNFHSTMDYKDELERYLYRQGVEKDKTIILLIDEGQKLTPPFLEVLRTLLNYETNEYKLLQLVIMAQLELLPRLRKIRNFMDRVSLKYIINPLTEAETKEMIDFRLRQAGYEALSGLFTEEAVSEIYYHTQGYPRRIALLCHASLEYLIMKDKPLVDRQLIREIINEEVS